jgi:hypothetical protein
MEGSDRDAALACSWSVSTNGGLTWGARVLIPGVNTLKGGPDPRGADAVAAVDPSGNLYVTTLGASTTPQALAMFLSKSVDGGQSFAAPRLLFKADATYDPDKEWIAINPYRNSPTFNRIAVAFTREGGSNQIQCTYSDDSGITWSPLKALGSTNVTYALPYFLPDGSLAVVYRRDLHGYLTGTDLIEVVVSQDGGASFGAPRQVLDLRSIQAGYHSAYQDPVAFAYSDLTASVDRQAGVMYAAITAWYGPLTNRAPRILFTKSIDKGGTWSKSAAGE